MSGEQTEEQSAKPPVLGGLRGVLHIIATGFLMGVANIIPGVSGGTMILAMGHYERFVDSVADLTRLRFRMDSVAFLGLLGVSAAGAILISVTPILWGLTHHQHIMFALFIGLTLGGVPLIWKDLRPISSRGASGAVGGLIFMVLISFALQQIDLPPNAMFLFCAGIIGSAAMVLPGISGSYLLLALGLYSHITGGISEFKDALKAVDFDEIWRLSLSLILPVGLGIAVGIVGLTNLLKATLNKFHDLTLGSLLGLLLGSVFFLNPFREPGHKDPFTLAAEINAANLTAVAACIALGFAMTFLVSRLEGEESKK